MDIKVILSDIRNAKCDQETSNKVHDYLAQTMAVLGDLEGQALINQSVIYKFKNLNKEGLCLGDIMLMEAEYIKAKSMYYQLHLDKSKALELESYLKGLTEGLPKPKQFIEQLVQTLLLEDK